MHKRKKIAVFLVGIMLVVGGRMFRSCQLKQKVKPGVEFLARQEKYPIHKIERHIKKNQENLMKKRLEEQKEQIEKGEIDVWSLFSNIMILGDSRAVGFDVFGCLPPNQVVAAGGNNINAIEEAVPKIREMNPAAVFLCYGVNDIGIGTWETPEKYASAYIKIVKKMQKTFPGIKFYVNSTLPTEERAFQKNPRWKRIPEYNRVLKEACEKNHIGYVDCTKILEEHSDLYDVDDGIHMRKEFYPYWGTQMIQTLEAR